VNLKIILNEITHANIHRQT